MAVDMKLVEASGAAESENTTSSSVSIDHMQYDIAAQNAVRYLVRAKRSNANISDIEAFDLADKAIQSVRDQVLDLCQQQDIPDEVAEGLAAKITLYAQEYYSNGATSDGLPVRITAVLSQTMPEMMFQDGHYTRLVIRENTVADAGLAEIVSHNNMGGGVTSTSNTNADTMLAMYSGGNMFSLWVGYEAPDKHELQGIANQSIMAALGQIAAGDMSPADLAALLEQLDVLAQHDLISSEMLSILQNLQEIQTLAALEVTPEIASRLQELSDQLTETLSSEIENGKISPDMARNIIEALSGLAEQHDLSALFSPDIIQSLETKVQIQELKDHLGELASGLDSISQAELQALIESMDGLEGQAFLDHLETIREALGNFDVPAELKGQLDLAVTSIDGLTETLSVQLADAQDLLNLIQQLDKIDFESLSAEQQATLEKLQEILETLDIENLTVDQLKAALTDPSNPIAAAVQNLVLELNQEAVQLALPQEALNTTNQFLNSHSDVVEGIVINSVVQDLQTALDAMDDKTSPEAQKIQETIDKLEAGESLDTIDPAVLQQVAEKLGDQTPEALTQAVEKLNHAQAENAILSSETLQAVVAMTGDLESVVETLKAEGNTELAEKIESVIEALKEDPARISSLAELSQLDGDALKAVIDSLPPEMANKVENLAKDVSEITTIQAEALAIKHGIDVQDIQSVAETIAVMNATREGLEASGIDVDSAIEALQSDPTSLEAAAEVAKLESIMNDPNTSPEVREAIAEKLGEKIEPLREMQAEALSEKMGIDVATANQVIEVFSSVESARADLEAAGIDVDNLQQVLSGDASPAEIVEMLKAADLSSPDVQKALETAGVDVSNLESLTQQRIEQVAQELGVTPEQVKAVISGSVEGLDSSNVTSIHADGPAKMDPIVQQLNAIADAVHADAALPAAKATAIAQSVEKFQALANKIASGQPVTAAEAAAALTQADTALSKMDDGPLKTQLEAARQEVGQQVKDVPGMDQKLAAEPGNGCCGVGPCTHNPTQDARQVFDRDDSPISVVKADVTVNKDGDYVVKGEAGKPEVTISKDVVDTQMEIGAEQSARVSEDLASLQQSQQDARDAAFGNQVQGNDVANDNSLSGEFKGCCGDGPCIHTGVLQDGPDAPADEIDQYTAQDYDTSAEASIENSGLEQEDILSDDDLDGLDELEDDPCATCFSKACQRDKKTMDEKATEIGEKSSSEFDEFDDSDFSKFSDQPARPAASGPKMAA